MSMTNRTLPLTDRQVLYLFIDVPTDITSLRGGEEAVYLHNLLAVPFCLVGEHGNESTPTCIGDRFSKAMVSFHSFNVQVLNADGIISPYKGNGTLVQVVGTAVANFFVKSGYFEFLVFKPSAAFLLARKILLRLSKSALVFLCVSVIIECFSFRSDKQVLQSQINTYGLARFFNRCNVFLLREYGNEILAAWCLGNSYLTYFPDYLTMYTALDTLFELGYENPVSCDRCELWYGETILGMFRFEAGKFRTFLKEISIGNFKGANSKLQGLGVYFLEPCGCFLLLHFSEKLCLCIIIITLTCEPILSFALIEKVVVHKARTTEMPCQQLGLLLIRVQSELICSINLSHITYKDNNNIVKYKTVLYIYGIKDSYTHKNRHKYYLKCHLIFCIKYRRKILEGKFNSDIKAMLQSIANNSNFGIDIMETDKDHIHLLVSYPPKMSVTSIVRKLKQESTVFAWNLHKSMLRNYFWKERTLWSDGYFVCSIGEANPNTVKEYIRNQG